jgi:hypothetical protein
MRWAGHAARMGEMRYACQILVEKPEGHRPLQMEDKWEDDIKIVLKKYEEYWIHLLRIGTFHLSTVIRKNSENTSKRTHHISITRSVGLIMFRKMTLIYSGNQMKHINTLSGLNNGLMNVKASGTHTSHCRPTLKELLHANNSFRTLPTIRL